MSTRGKYEAKVYPILLAVLLLVEMSGLRLAAVDTQAVPAVGFISCPFVAFFLGGEHAYVFVFVEHAEFVHAHVCMFVRTNLSCVWDRASQRDGVSTKRAGIGIRGAAAGKGEGGAMPLTALNAPMANPMPPMDEKLPSDSYCSRWKGERERRRESGGGEIDGRMDRQRSRAGKEGEGGRGRDERGDDDTSVS